MYKTEKSRGFQRDSSLWLGFGDRVPNVPPFHKPRVLIAAPHSGSGKTTLTLGLIGALLRRGLNVAGFKVGPDYIDSCYLSYLTGNHSSNLDAFLMRDDVLLGVFGERSLGADVAVIEGVMGLFDGIGATREASTAHVAALLGTPVLLVVNGRGMAASAAALVRGFMGAPGVDVKGVVFNGVSAAHYRILREATERDCGIKCLGFFPKMESISIKSRHLGIMPASELADVDARLSLMADLVCENVDVDEVLRIASDVQQLDFPAKTSFRQIRYTVAVPRDAAFNFYYEEALETLRNMGAKLVYFSPLADAGLPNCDGIYIGGGFPEVFARELSQNVAMRTAILNASLAGMPIYAECGGYMYLSRSITTDAEYEMCGALPVSCIMGSRLSGQFGYVDVKLNIDTPLGKSGTKYRAHEFHHSAMLSETGAYSAEKADGRSWHGGTVLRNTFGTYAHVNFAGEAELAANFLEKCRAFSR